MLWIFVGALAIGLSLGLMGSGGSILTVPVLTYLVGQDEKVAIAGSLGIVGAISLVAGVPYARRGLADYRSILFFGVPGMAGAWLGAFLSQFVAGSVQLFAFAGLMLAAALLMLRPLQVDAQREAHARSVIKIGAEGLVVGIVTGFVGVGGGFLIVPALVLLGGLSMHRAVGTSLFIIALKSFAGFVGYLGVLAERDLHLDWQVLGAFAGLGILGSFLGNALGKKLPQQALRRAFAIFLLVISVVVVAKTWPDVVEPDAPSAVIEEPA